MSFETGSLIGDYEIVGVLGTGGMGKVYKVRNTISDRIEAMKVLLPNLDADQELAERFLREIKVQASLQHPNIASLRTAQRVNNQLLMIMEFVEGSTVEAIMRQRRIPLQECVKYGSQVLSALAYAHAKGVVHRDIKPPNIMLTPEGLIKLMDFGIAKLTADRKLTQTGRTVGSLFYMSPEQIRGGDVDGRSDLYSFGVTLYEMVTGKRPFEGDSDYSIMAAHLQQPPQPPIQLDTSLPQALNDVILLAIAKDPAQRFQTADAFRTALESVAKGIGVSGAVAGAGVGATQMFGSTAPPPMPPPQNPIAQMPPPAAMQAQPQAGRSYRGLYMVMGSLVTIGILAAAAIYVPKLLKTRANGGTAQVAQIQPAPMPSQPPPQPSMGQPSPAKQPEPSPEAQSPAPTAQPTQSSPVQKQVAAPPRPQAPIQESLPQQQPPQQVRPLVQQPVQQLSPQPAPPQQSLPQQPAPQQPSVVPSAPMPQPHMTAPALPPANAAEMEALNQRKLLMHSRIDAVNASMTRLEQQQRQMGVGMNGDLVARQHRMVFYMETSDSAMRKGNVEQARTNLDKAELELDKLEEHFGR